MNREEGERVVCPATLAPFFRLLAQSIEQNQLSEAQLLQASEFYMQYVVGNELIGKEVSDSDTVKFFSIGFFIHHMLNGVFTRSPEGDGS